MTTQEMFRVLRINQRAFDAFDAAERKAIRAELGRHECGIKSMTVMISSPGFWDEGPNKGVGISVRRCPKCAPITEEVMRDIIGGAEVRS